MAHALVTTLSNVRLLRKFIKELRIPLNVLVKITKNFQTVIDEIQEDNKKREAEEEAKRTYLKALAKKLESDGIDTDELLQTLQAVNEQAKPRKTRAKRPPKFRYIDDDGVERTWTGQGNTPKPIQRALDNGATLNDFAI